MKIVIAIVTTALIALIVGLILGAVGSKIWFQKELKKNPPLDEKKLRILMKELGINNEKKLQILKRKMKVGD